MRNIIIKGLALILIWGAIYLSCVPLSSEKAIKEEVIKEVKNKKVQTKKVMVQVMHNEEEKQIELEEYLLGVVASEMPYTFELEALKAQCVAARTFVLQRGLKVDDTTSSQVYHSSQELKEIHQDDYDLLIDKISKALQATRGKVMKYKGEYISALFYSSNNGKSNDGSWYYKQETPYLKSVDSPWDLTFENTKANIHKGVSECTQALGTPNMNIGAIHYYDNAYVKDIEIGDQVFSGREVREKLKLRSSCFNIVVSGNDVSITTSGFGHGVGMSQYGAQGMAKEGYSYEEILKHYYTGIEIVNL